MFFDKDYVPLKLNLLTYLVSSTRKSSSVSKHEIAREVSTSEDSCHKVTTHTMNVIKMLFPKLASS